MELFSIGDQAFVVHPAIAVVVGALFLVVAVVTVIVAVSVFREWSDQRAIYKHFPKSFRGRLRR